ncbi:carbohydrate-binding protein [Paenibacillus psychroresistens]|nr:CBM35 domain-containing protein [Paenibacillus psychroresistens]
MNNIMGKQNKTKIRSWALVGMSLIMSGVLAIAPASARESQFTQDGTGPLYWSTYEYQYTHDSPMDEQEWKKNIDWIAKDYKASGYNMVTADGWIEQAQETNENGYILNHNDNWTHDWTYWANYIQKKGLDMGMYYNPLWVTRSAASDPSKKVVGTNYLVKDIASSKDTFNKDLYWLDVAKPGAEEYLKGYIQYFKNMGVTFLRIDFLSWYETGRDKDSYKGIDHGTENYKLALKWMHEAAGNDMELSLVMPHLKNHAASELPYGDMVRINEDLAHGGWQNLSGQRQNWINGWSQWANPFMGFTGFSDIAGRGSNMILDGDFIRMNKFSNDDERRSIINLFTMAGSPIAITDQYSTISTYGSFYKNANMLDLHNQGFVGKPYYRNGNPFNTDPNARDSEKWLGQLPDGSWVVSLFNRDDSSQVRSVDYKTDLGLNGSASTKDLWTNANLGSIASLNPNLNAHASKIVQISPVGSSIRYQSEVATWLNGTHFNNDHKGYSGFGFVDGLGNVGAKIVYAVEAPSTGSYPISYRYGNSVGTTSTMKVKVVDENGTSVQPAKTVSFPNLANWDTWSNKSDQISLKKGVNLITIERTAADSGAINLDYIELDKTASGTASLIQNAGFESNNLNGWSEWHPDGQSAAFGVDTNDNHSGMNKLYFHNNNAFKQSVHQKLSGLTNGSYTVSAWVKERVYGGNPLTVRMELADYGGSALYANINPSDVYTKISRSVNVSNGQLDIGFYLDSPGNTSLQIDDVSIVKN